MDTSFIRQSGTSPRDWDNRYRHIGGLMEGVRYETVAPSNLNTRETSMNRADRVLYRRAVGAAPHMRSGRQRVALSDRTMFDGMYTCKVNLAGELYLATRRGKLYEIPIRPISTECGHADCRYTVRIKPGGVFDAIVMLIPEEFTDQLELGSWPSQYIPEPKVWQEHYHYAVKAARKMRGILSENKRKPFYGLGFEPQSQFGETVLYLIRLFGLPGIAVYHTADRMNLFADAMDGRIGSSMRLTSYFQESSAKHSLDTSNYSRSFYVITQLKGKFPEVPFPLQDFCNHIDRITRNPYRAYHTMVSQYYLRPAKKLIPEVDIDELQPQDGMSERESVARNIGIVAEAEKVRYRKLQVEGKAAKSILSDPGLIILYNTRKIFSAIDSYVNKEFGDLTMSQIIARTDKIGHMELEYTQPTTDEIVVAQSLSDYVDILPDPGLDELPEDFQDPIDSWSDVPVARGVSSASKLV